MPVEIERKFLVASESWRAHASCATPIRQGYLHADARKAVRVRLKGQQGVLTIKGSADATGIARAEFEYIIPAQDAQQLLDTLCVPGKIEKVRHLVEHAGKQWEVDVFEGENAGLVVAELELSAVEEDFERPPWLGQEVSHDARYLNAQLAKLPFTRW